MTNRRKILIVDDEPEIGRLLHLFLEDDFEVEVFSDPRLACERVKEAAFDLVISDVKMPFINGMDVLKFVKNTRPSTLVILITGHAQTPAETSLAKSLGAENVLFKPFGDPGKILDLIHKLFAAHPAMNASQVAVNVDKGTIPYNSAGLPESGLNKNSAKPIILALDDEPDLIEVLSLLLEDDFDVRLFVDPSLALAEYKVNSCKLILTDLNMPLMSGVEFITKVRELDKSIPIIVMSGHGAAELEVQKALEAGANDMMPKPFPEPDIVVQIIRKSLKL